MKLKRRYESLRSVHAADAGVPLQQPFLFSATSKHMAVIIVLSVLICFSVARFVAHSSPPSAGSLSASQHFFSGSGAADHLDLDTTQIQVRVGVSDECVMTTHIAACMWEGRVTCIYDMRSPWPLLSPTMIPSNCHQ